MVDLPFNWEPRDYQEPALQFYEWGGKRGVLIWHRRAGKDTFGLNLTVKKSAERVGLYWHIFPTYNMGRKILWNGMTGDGRKFLSFWPDEVIERQLDDEMYIETKWGSAWQIVGTDDPDRLVGSNPVGVVFSEYSLMDPTAWDLIRPILAENGGWALFIYTPRSRNHGWTLLQNALKKPPIVENGRYVGGWFTQVLTVDDTKKMVDGHLVPVVSQEAIQDDRDNGMAEEKVQQEYWCSFDAALEGSYYGEMMKDAYASKRIGVVEYEPQLPVSTMWDLGVGDNNVIWFFQEIGREIRFIDYEEGHGKGLPHYAGVLQERALSRRFVYDRHYGPHDLSVTEYATGKRRIDTARDLGIRFDVVKKHKLEDGIDAVRASFPRFWFDAKRCEKGLNALQQYRKEFDEKTNSYHDAPVKDWTNHAADSLRTGVWGIRKNPKKDNLPAVADGTYNPIDERTLERRPAFAEEWNPL